MFKAFAQLVNTSFDVPTVEKESAQKAIDTAYETTALLDQAITHLDKIYNPFKENQETIPADYLKKKRHVIRRFAKKVKENYNQLKEKVLYTIKYMNEFSNDSDVVDIVDAFSGAVEDLEIKVEDLLDCFEDYEDKDFIANVIKFIDAIKKQSDEIKTVLDERAIDYFNRHILGESWMHARSEELDLDIYNSAPDILKARNQQDSALSKKDQVDQALHGKSQGDQEGGTSYGETQSLNPMDAQRIMYPNYSRFQKFEMLLNSLKK